MEFHNGSEEDIERLSKAIVDAIINSKDVRRILSDLIEKDVIIDKGFIMLMIKMQTLAELASSAERAEGRKRQPRRKNSNQFIDGRELTPNEIAFLEYCARKFNEKDWLKRVGITMEEI